MQRSEKSSKKGEKKEKDLSEEEIPELEVKIEKPMLLPKEFNNQSSIQKWFDEFEVVAGINSWNNDVKLKMLPAFFKRRCFAMAQEECFSYIMGFVKKELIEFFFPL